ncbi:MAG: Rossmann fold nucleotide-binding protein Smf possibly involved in DNA uptake, partial [uncultured Solirubrobacterales bacterium]
DSARVRRLPAQERRHRLSRTPAQRGPRRPRPAPRKRACARRGRADRRRSRKPRRRGASLCGRLRRGEGAKLSRDGRGRGSLSARWSVPRCSPRSRRRPSGRLSHRWRAPPARADSRAGGHRGRDPHRFSVRDRGGTGPRPRPRGRRGDGGQRTRPRGRRRRSSRSARRRGTAGGRARRRGRRSLPEDQSSSARPDPRRRRPALRAPARPPAAALELSRAQPDHGGPGAVDRGRRGRGGLGNPDHGRVRRPARPGGRGGAGTGDREAGRWEQPPLARGSGRDPVASGCSRRAARGRILAALRPHRGRAQCGQAAPPGGVASPGAQRARVGGVVTRAEVHQGATRATARSLAAPCARPRRGRRGRRGHRARDGSRTRSRSGGAGTTRAHGAGGPRRARELRPHPGRPGRRRAYPRGSRLQRGPTL